MKRTFSMRRASAGLAAFAVLAFAAVFGDDRMDGMDHGDGSSSEEEAQDFNDPDVMFAQMMIPHHEQAVDMAETEIADGRNAEAKELAAQITESQAAEVTQIEAIIARL
jgi:uncharacterized protein (DUF305 family)